MKNLQSLPAVLAVTTMILGAFSIPAKGSGAAGAVTTFDSLVRNYNLVSFGNASFTNYGDTEGGLAVKGNLTLNGAGAIGNQPSKYGVTSDPTLFVSGQLTSNSYTDLNSGYASTQNATGWTWNENDKRLTKGSGTLSVSNSNPRLNPMTGAGPSGWDWNSIESQFQTVSNTLYVSPITGNISVSGQTLMFSSTGASAGDVVMFHLDASLLSGLSYNGISFSSLNVSVPTDVNYVVNVTNAGGKTLFGTKDGGANLNGSGYERLLWNILPDTNVGGDPIATSVTIGSREFKGSILAPLVDISNSDRVTINGQVVAKSLSYSGNELHYVGYDASSVTFSAVPEPSTYGLAGLALCGGAIGLRFWRRRKTAAAQK